MLATTSSSCVTCILDGHFQKSEINIACWPEVKPESSLFMLVKRWLWWKLILFCPGYLPVSFELSGAPQNSAMKISPLPVTGSTAFHGHHFMHLKNIIWFQHVLKSFGLAHICAVHFIFVDKLTILWMKTDSIGDTWMSCRSSVVFRSEEFIVLSGGESS